MAEGPNAKRARTEEVEPPTVAEFIMTDAKERGLLHVFGVPGSGSPMDLMEEGRKIGVDFVCVAHESSAAIAAAYYGYLKAKTPGIAICIKAVGLGNLIGGMYNAVFERMPVLCISEQRPTSQPVTTTMVQNLPLESQVEMFPKGVLSYAGVLLAETAASTVRDAIAATVRGREGVAFLDFPSDQSLKRMPRAALPVPAANVPSAPAPDAAMLAQVVAFISKAKRLAIIAGQDIVRADACGELLAFVERTHAGVLCTMEARGVIDETGPWWQGVFVARGSPHTAEAFLFEQADAILVIGCDTLMKEGRFENTAHLAGKPVMELCHSAEYVPLSPSGLHVRGDLKVGLAALAKDCPAANPGFSHAELKRLRESVVNQYFARPTQAQFTIQDVIHSTQKALPANGIAFGETGIQVIFMETLWHAKAPQRFFHTSGGRTMGLTVPAMLGAKLAQPDVAMVGFCGDGSLMMRLGELEVFSRYGVKKCVLVVLNDQALGTMLSRQRARGLTEYSLTFHPKVELAAVAEGLGLRGVKVDTPAAFETAINQAVNAESCTLIDARIDPRPYQDSFGASIGKP